MNKEILGFICLFLFFGAGCNSALQSFKKGEKRFKQGEYQVAIEHYEKAKAKNFVPALVNSSIASAYRLSNRIEKAAPYYREALAAGSKEDTTLFYYAYALKAQGSYKEAASQFEQYIKSGKNLKNKAMARKELENLPKIEEIMRDKTFYEIENLSLLNTSASEYSPALQSDTLVFSSSRKSNIYKATGTGFDGIYTYNLKADSVAANDIKLFSTNVHMENVNEASPTFSRDGRTMVFARGNTGKRKGSREVDLYISRFKDGKWSEPELLPISKPEAWDASPAISTDGKTLYFASNREGGFGGIDLYRATSDASGRFGRVVNMGPEINTAGNEMFPYVSDDGKLFFSSDGHPGLGRLDIFVANRKEGTITVKNMGIPMNSPADDFGIVFKDPQSGYFTSDREGGKGNDDIYSFADKTPDYKIVNYFLAGVTVTRDPQTNEEIILGSTKIRFLEGDKVIGETTTATDGAFKFKVQESKNYTIVAEKPTYFTRREFFSMSGRSIPQEQLVKPVTDTTFHVKVPLDKVEKNKIFVIENIYYDLDKADIRSDAAEELDKLVDFLKDNPTIKIELSSHTDVRAADEYNMKLSQRRAESAVNYLIKNGIDPTKITAKGYGETRLIAPDAQTEEEHQRNRRTEIKILEVNQR
jgi:outer membrane protein OmpA-like peptidoglycan-associated protein/Tol biopolymer transport system component